MKEEKVIGKLYLFKLCDDSTVERRELNLISKNASYYIIRDMSTNKKNSYAIEDLNVYKSHRVLLDTDDMALAKDIMVKGLFRRMLDAQTKATIALNNYTNFREVNR